MLKQIIPLLQAHDLATSVSFYGRGKRCDGQTLEAISAITAHVRASRNNGILVQHSQNNVTGGKQTL